MVTRSALIGHTGFVGSNLASAATFDSYYNSKNISEIRGQEFDEIVCCGVSAVKWWANKHPNEDLAAIERLQEELAFVKAKRFILISTVDVYAVPIGVNEDTEIDLAALEPYGSHRYAFERFVSERFSSVNIVRLPALFGDGLKKNAIFDILNNNMVEKIHPESCFQWYPLSRLKRDIDIVSTRDLRLVNLVSKPLKMETIIEAFARGAAVGASAGPPIRYDVNSKYPRIFDGEANYAISDQYVWEELDRFFEKARGV